MKYFALQLILLFTALSCKNVAPIQDSIPPHETFILKSSKLSEDRVINVWTPENYTENSEKFPVLYMPDGGLKEDFPHLAKTISELIDSKKIPPMILVGIENTQRRRDLTGPTLVAKDKEIAPIVGGSANFRNFIKDELIPEINKKYRTTDKKSIIGESLAGLFVGETFLTEPDLFDNYIAFDPSFWWNDHYLMKNSAQYLSKFPSTEKRFWFAGSSATDILKYTNELSENLKSANIPNLKWNYSPEPKEEHSTIFRATKEKALIWTFGN